MIHAIIPAKYQKYPTTTTLTHVNALDKINKSHQGRLQNMTPRDNYSITIHGRIVALYDISH